MDGTYKHRKVKFRKPRITNTRNGLDSINHNLHTKVKLCSTQFSRSEKTTLYKAQNRVFRQGNSFPLFSKAGVE